MHFQIIFFQNIYFSFKPNCASIWYKIIYDQSPIPVIGIALPFTIDTEVARFCWNDFYADGLRNPSQSTIPHNIVLFNVYESEEFDQYMNNFKAQYSVP